MKRARIHCLNNLPINNVYCVGRNYAEHAKELKNEIPDEPLIFLKSNACITEIPESISLPEYSQDVHHEVELVLAIHKDGYQIPKQECTHYIGAIAVGIDMTARDVQSILKKEGKPWTKAKSFNDSAIISEWEAFKSSKYDLTSLDLQLDVNSQTRQLGSTCDMLFPVQEIIHYLSHQFPLFAGDIIYTGTPAGVGKLTSGDHVEAFLKPTDCRLQFTIN